MILVVPFTDFIGGPYAPKAMKIRIDSLYSELQNNVMGRMISRKAPLLDGVQISAIDSETGSRFGVLFCSVQFRESAKFRNSAE